MHSFIESHLSDTENIKPFKNTAKINQNKKVKITDAKIDQINQSGIFERYDVSLSEKNLIQ